MRKYSTALLTALLALACLYPVPAGAQGERGRMIKRFALPSDPVDEITPEVGGKAVRFNGVFNAGHDWLKGLKVKLRNRSGKNIIFAEALLNIPKMGTMELPLGIPVRYGQLPALGDPLEVSPVKHGEAFKLSLSDQIFDSIMTFLAEHQVTDVVGVEMSHLMIVYDDDTGWNDGTLLRRDRTRPYSWKSAGEAKPVGDDKPAEESKAPREVFQNISLTKPAKYNASWAIDDVSPFDYSCTDFVKFDYAMCNEFLGNWACVAQSDSA